MSSENRMNPLLESSQDKSLADWKGIVSRLVMSSVERMDHIGGGKYSRVYRVICSNKEQYAAKFYLGDPFDSRDRQGIEFSSIAFLWKQGVTNLPLPIVSDPKVGCAVYDFIPGEKIMPHAVTGKDIDAVVNFVEDLKRFSNYDESQKFPRATGACFSVQEIVENIQRRIHQLTALQVEGRQNEEFRDFLNQEFIPLFEELQEWCQKGLAKSGLSYHHELPAEQRILSPSDFGFHNALRVADGTIAFLDFEDFGWDDPARMIADFLLHPSLEIDAYMKRRILNGMRRVFHDQPDLPQRLGVIYPLTALKGCMMFLNESVSPFSVQWIPVAEVLSEKGRAPQLSLQRVRGLLKGIEQSVRQGMALPL